MTHSTDNYHLWFDKTVEPLKDGTAERMKEERLSGIEKERRGRVEMLHSQKYVIVLFVKGLLPIS